MASDSHRERQRSDTPTPFLSPSANETVAEGSQLLLLPETYETQIIQASPGQYFANQNISGNARAHIGNVYNIGTKEGKTAEEQGYQDVKNFLAFGRMDFRRSAIDGAYADTCRWILEEEHFLRWLDPTLRDSHHVHIPVRPSEDGGWEIPVIRGKFREACLQLRNEHLIVMIDALDECEQSEVRDMILFLNSLAESTRRDSISFHSCFASRHYPSISTRFCESVVIENQSAHTEDIRKYVWDNLHVESHMQSNKLPDTVVTKAQGSFLWAVLVTRLLNEHIDRGSTPEGLHAVTRALPGNLKTLISSIIANGASDEYLLPALMWAFSGLPRLTASEYCLATQFSGRQAKLTRREYFIADQNAMQKFITHSSKGLVEVRFTDTIGGQGQCQFIHESVRQHVVSGGLAGLHPDLKENVEAAGHAILADWCQEYIQASWADYMLNLINGMTDWRSQPNPSALAIHQYPLLPYVYMWTFSHLNSAYMGRSYDIRRLNRFPMEAWMGFKDLRNDTPQTSRVRSYSSAYVALAS
ncbi:hypothetical protein Q7P37_010270 [Cladosporium fusiforme]